jgi:hypothetical protein
MKRLFQDFMKKNRHKIYQNQMEVLEDRLNERLADRLEETPILTYAIFLQVRTLVQAALKQRERVQ